MFASLAGTLLDASHVRRAFTAITKKAGLGGHPDCRCPCAAQHGGTGRYVFLSPDGGHYRRSNYGRRVFRPACDGRYEPGTGRPARLVIADATTWPGTPLAAWPATQPGITAAFSPLRGRGIQAIPEDTPLTCWRPIPPKQPEGPTPGTSGGACPTSR